MAKTKGTEPHTKKGGKPANETPGNAKDRESETRGQNEQDVARRSGNFEGAGEAPYRQPGRRQ
jgi:hypothetical protein